MSQPVTIYTLSHCPYCQRAKNLLESLKIPYKETSLDGKEEELKILREKTHFQTVPQIFIHEKFIGGYQELSKLEEDNKLQELL